MTSEQIAELRETLRAENTPVWGVTDGKTVTWTTTPDVSEKITLALRRWLPKLLDEREALLGALTGLEVWVTKNVAADFTTGDMPPQSVEALATARRVLDQVSK